ncbi:MAG: hypothetical protein WDN24_09275 [Sphingomonas sp.]
MRRDGAGHGCEFLVPLPRREMDRAFKGQDEVLAQLNAAFGRPPAEAPVPPESAPPPPPRRRPRFGWRLRRLRRLWRR